MLKFFLLNNPGDHTKFVPNTKHTGKYDLKGFLSYLSEKNSGISMNTYKEVFETMTNAVKEILADGSVITIPGFMRISAVVKGAFGSHEERFDRSKHGIGIVCTALPDFIAKVSDGIKVKKIEKPGRNPYINGMSEYGTKREALHRDYANSISGAYFRQKCYWFTGMDIMGSGQGMTVHLEKNDINIIKQGGSEILFTFKRNYVFPDWLVNETVIFVSFIYRNKAGFTLPFRAYKTVWLC